MKFTQEQVNAYYARQGKPAASETAGVEREADLHEAILAECKDRGFIALHGSMAHRTYRTVGENDFHCLLPNGRIVFVECKTGTGKLSIEQLAMAVHMRQLGHTLYVVRSLSQFQDLCARLLSGGNMESSPYLALQAQAVEKSGGNAPVGVAGNA